MTEEDFDIRNSQTGYDRDKDIEKALRPSEFDSFSGQDKVVDNLQVLVDRKSGVEGKRV